MASGKGIWTVYVVARHEGGVGYSDVCAVYTTREVAEQRAAELDKQDRIEWEPTPDCDRHTVIEMELRHG